MTTLTPQTPEQVQEIVQAHEQLLPVSGRSKPALSTGYTNVTLVDMSQLRDLIEYEPNEFTFTAYAGTPLSEITAALAEHGQYLPFDPLLVAAGATLGGTVAANTSGSGRFRYGGVRDFILGIRFVDGYGRLVRGGGKVVKNAAGFDLPKFMTGALGRFGILTELTFKVFPAPAAYTTVQATADTLEDTLNVTFALASKPYEINALDIQPQAADCYRLLLRLGGLPQALPDRVDRLQRFLREKTAVTATSTITDDTEHKLWADFNALTWADPACHLIKVPIAPKQAPDLLNIPAIKQAHLSAAANIAWLTTDAPDTLAVHLAQLGLVGLVLRGDGQRPYLGRLNGLALAQRVKQALDPNNKFLGIEA